MNYILNGGKLDNCLGLLPEYTICDNHLGRHLELHIDTIYLHGLRAHHRRIEECGVRFGARDAHCERHLDGGNIEAGEEAASIVGTKVGGEVTGKDRRINFRTLHYIIATTCSLLFRPVFRRVRSQEEPLRHDPNAAGESNIDLQLRARFHRLVQVDHENVQLGQMTRSADTQLGLLRCRSVSGGAVGWVNGGVHWSTTWLD